MSSGILNREVYRIQVQAFNSVGTGPLSSVTTATPNAALQSAPTVAPSFADVNFNYFANSPLYVNWGWEYLDEHYSSINPPLQGYMVEVRALDDNTLQTCRVEDIFGFECTFTNVRDGVEYSVRIAAFNSAGVGTFSAPVTRRSLSGKPTAAPTGLEVDAVSEPGNVIVSWDVLPEEHAGAVPVRAYVATAIAVSGANVGPSQRRRQCFAGPDPIRQGAGSRTSNGPITVTSCRLPAGDPFHGLVPGVEYQVRVRAIGTGHGPDFSSGVGYAWTAAYNRA